MLFDCWPLNVRRVFFFYQPPIYSRLISARDYWSRDVESNGKCCMHISWNWILPSLLIPANSNNWLKPNRRNFYRFELNGPATRLPIRLFLRLVKRAFHCNGAATSDMQIRKRATWIDRVMTRSRINSSLAFSVPQRNSTRTIIAKSSINIYFNATVYRW